MRRRSGQAQLTCSPEHLVCPTCGYSVLRRRGFLSRWAERESFCCALDRITVGTLEQIVALPDALGEHACEECGHPNMRSLMQLSADSDSATEGREARAV
jgi:rRNA maturation endonuclease Nob1